MPRQTPFFSRLEPYNKPKIWDHWAGYLSAPRYQYSAITEYYAIRDGVGVFDTSPLFKYRISGSGAGGFLDHVMVRPMSDLAVGKGRYSCWCNPEGFVMEDGVVLRAGEDEFLLATVQPNLRYLRGLASSNDVDVDDISEAYGVLALQGPHSHTVLRRLTSDVDGLGYFGVARTLLRNIPVMLSRTGFTGDLGYEIWVEAESAVALFDLLFEEGGGYNIKPVGETALSMARIEAGLLLIDVDFQSARFAWVDAQRETPAELGWGWMVDVDREFIGRSAIATEYETGSTRWSTVGLTIDWHEYERLYRGLGLVAPKEGVLAQETMTVYRSDGTYAGYATSFVYSSLLKRHIAIAKLPLDLAKPGSAVQLELVPIHRPENVQATVVDLPFYAPARKTAMIGTTRSERT
ncbi:MAG: aminomethyltransferase family protein [Acidimicrobiia bacterium]|nr:aminomethyltransferase family protein [Acidimicrobiia bacterium]NNL29235.1 aminomethyl transferase family protein [Acidimicrobiia bacterium]